MTNAKRLYAAAILLLGLLWVGCSPKYYVPNTLNVPMIQAKGQTNLTLAVNDNQGELQGARGLTDSLALQVNLGFVNPKAEDNGNNGSGTLLEVGLGYYRNLTPSLLFDVYGLLGAGSVKNDFPSSLAANPGTTGKISAEMSRFGVQPSLTLHGRRFSLSGSVRLSALHYRKIEGSLIFAGENQVDYLNRHKSQTLFEPALTFRAGGGKVGLQVQLVRSVNLTDSDFRQDDGVATVGINFRFGRKP
jgi:hypothetical protein